MTCCDQEETRRCMNPGATCDHSVLHCRVAATVWALFPVLPCLCEPAFNNHMSGFKCWHFMRSHSQQPCCGCEYAWTCYAVLFEAVSFETKKCDVRCRAVSMNRLFHNTFGNCCAPDGCIVVCANRSLFCRFLWHA